MRCALFVPNFGAYGDTRLLCDLARDAERAGWDGFFLWDHLVASPPVVNPMVALTAIASATTTITLGPMVLPLPRRRPWKLALEAATLQQVSGGRLILGISIGVPRDYATFGEDEARRLRVERLEEGVEVLRACLSGDRVDFAGRHYRVSGATFQQVDVPVWIGAFWPRVTPIYGARHADGYFPNVRTPDGAFRLPDPGELAEMRARFRADGGPDDAELAIWSPGTHEDADLDALAAAGVTWWLQDAWQLTPDDLAHRVAQGPPATAR